MSKIISILVLIIGIFGLISIIGTRHYKLDDAYLRIKSCRKCLSAQEVWILCGIVFCCILIPLFFIEQLISGKFSIIRFDRYVLGEGLEKRNDNFADEVMSQLGK